MKQDVRTSHGGKNFRPTEAASDAPRSGQRREIERRASFVWQWPKGTQQRRDAFRTWQAVAMQVLHEANGSFRVMALIERFLNLATGTLWPSNETLALYGGGCSERTIKRDIALYEGLGLLRSTLGWRRNAAGKIVRTRLLHLALPADLKGSVMLPEAPNHGDTRGPDEWQRCEDNHGDHGCPNHGDNRGPITVEETVEEGAAHATRPL